MSSYCIRSFVLHVCVIFLTSRTTTTVAWLASPNLAQNNKLLSRRYVHATANYLPVTPVHHSIHHDVDIIEDRENHSSNQLSRLGRLLHAKPLDLIRFASSSTEESGGLRGVYLNRSVPAGEVILALPLDSSCLSDNKPPSWLKQTVVEDSSKWATRLAACWIDLYLRHKIAATVGQRHHDSDDTEQHQVRKGHCLWLSLLPDASYLRASLPVHWTEETVRNARSTSLEVAVDVAFFTRAEAVDDLVESLVESPYYLHKEENGASTVASDREELRALAQRALDLVQTRSCRLEESEDEHFRVLAPVFDFINYGSTPNAHFALERWSAGEAFLVVRALQDLEADEEVLIDYGASARPAWKCLMSYGFVPQNEQEDLAEVYMHGVRYEVSADTLPIEMVVAASAEENIQQTQNDQEMQEIETQEVVLTSTVARKIAERISEVGFFLLLEPELGPYEGFDEEESFELTASEVLSHKLAASLRWSQHKVLLRCATGLERYAEEEESQGKSQDE